jgi:hypothetical protein
MSEVEEEEREKSIRVMVMSMMILKLSSVVCLSGQSIDINNVNVYADVVGNGDGANGKEPFNGGVVDNSIRVRGNSNIGGLFSSVAGARNDSNSGEEVKDNKVVIDTGGKIWGYVFGGGSLGESNKVELIRGEVVGEVYGGYSVEGEAKGNIAEIRGGNVRGSVLGGRGEI